jgi:hypothetical protein
MELVTTVFREVEIHIIGGYGQEDLVLNLTNRMSVDSIVSLVLKLYLFGKQLLRQCLQILPTKQVAWISIKDTIVDSIH